MVTLKRRNRMAEQGSAGNGRQLEAACYSWGLKSPDFDRNLGFDMRLQHPATRRTWSMFTKPTSALSCMACVLRMQSPEIHGLKVNGYW